MPRAFAVRRGRAAGGGVCRAPGVAGRDFVGAACGRPVFLWHNSVFGAGAGGHRPPLRRTWGPPGRARISIIYYIGRAQEGVR